MSDLITAGLDLAKNVFQVHGADGYCQVVCFEASLCQSYENTEPYATPKGLPLS